MRAACSVFIATSLDGYIARLDGNIDWLEHVPVPEGEDFGYCDFMGSVDALVIGRNTYEVVASMPEWPYGDKPVVVLSSKLPGLPKNGPGRVALTREAPTQLVERLTAVGVKRIYVDGGVTIQGFLTAGLVDDITITRIPVLLGSGRPLFGVLAETWLEHVETRTFSCGYVQSKYRVPR